MPSIFASTDPQIWSRIIDVALLAIGAAIGWGFTILSEVRSKNRRHLDEFRAAIGNQLDYVIECENNGDSDFARIHAFTSSRLSRYALDIQAHDPRKWDRIGPSWEAYRGLVAGSAYGVAHGQNGEFISKEHLLNALNSLSRVVTKSI